MNSRHIVGCQNISANVNQLDPEHQQCHTHYKRQKDKHLLENERENTFFQEKILLKNILTVLQYLQY